MNFMEKMLSEQKKSDELEKARDRESWVNFFATIMAAKTMKNEKYLQ